MAGTVNCPRCQWPIPVGNVTSGVRIMCPKCSAAVVLKNPQSSGQTGQQRVSGTRNIPRPTSSLPTGGGPSRPRLERSTPIMRKVNRATPGGGRRSRDDEGGEDDRISRFQPQPKSNTGLYVGIGIAAVVVIVIIIAVASGGKKEDPKKKTGKKAPVVVQNTTPKQTPAPAAPVFTKFTAHADDPRADEGKIDNIDAAAAAELDKMLKDSGAKGGDQQIRATIKNDFKKYFPILIDRLASNDETIFNEAAVMANDIAKALGVSAGGGDLIDDLNNMKKYYDPDKRKNVYHSFFGLWGKKSFREDFTKKSLAGGAPPPPNPATPPSPNQPPDNNSTVTPVTPDNPPSPEQPSVDTSNLASLVRRPLGEPEVAEAANQIKSQGAAAYKELATYIDFDKFDMRQAQNAVRLLNVIAGKDWNDNLPKDNNWKQVKQDWESWASKQ